jgi:hypothetical protein
MDEVIIATGKVGTNSNNFFQKIEQVKNDLTNEFGEIKKQNNSNRKVILGSLNEIKKNLIENNNQSNVPVSIVVNNDPLVKEVFDLVKKNSNDIESGFKNDNIKLIEIKNLAEHIRSELGRTESFLKSDLVSMTKDFNSRLDDIGESMLGLKK